MQLAFPIKDYTLGIWYLRWDGHDWLMVTMRSLAGAVYGTSRIRHPDGQMTVQHMSPRSDVPETDAEAIDKLRKIASEVVAQFLVRSGMTLSSEGVIFDEVIVCGDDAKAVRLLRDRPWVVNDLPMPAGSN